VPLAKNLRGKQEKNRKMGFFFLVGGGEGGGKKNTFWLLRWVVFFLVFPGIKIFF